MNFCPECGAKLIADNKFCPECGNKLTTNKNSVTIKEQTDTESNKYIPVRSNNTGSNLAIFGSFLSLISMVSCFGGAFDSNKSLYDLSFVTFIGGLVLAIIGFAIKSRS